MTTSGYLLGMVRQKPILNLRVAGLEGHLVATPHAVSGRAGPQPGFGPVAYQILQDGAMLGRWWSSGHLSGRALSCRCKTRSWNATSRRKSHFH